MALTGGTLAIDRMLGRLAAAATSEHILGEATPALEAGARLAGQLIMGSLCVVALVAITGLFALLGHLLCDGMKAVPRLDDDVACLLFKGRWWPDCGLEDSDSGF